MEIKKIKKQNITSGAKVRKVSQINVKADCKSELQEKIAERDRNKERAVPGILSSST